MVKLVYLQRRVLWLKVKEVETTEDNKKNEDWEYLICKGKLLNWIRVLF